LNKSDADAVHDLIMATANHLQARAEKHYYAGFALSFLASPWEEFVEDLARIRTEFSWASEVVFSIQLQILNNFAKDDVRLYRRAETSGKWPVAAMANLKRCITELLVIQAIMLFLASLPRPSVASTVATMPFASRPAPA
jgi:predicted metal-dependent HD superfamily phosphohydrolase